MVFGEAMPRWPVKAWLRHSPHCLAACLCIGLGVTGHAGKLRADRIRLSDRFMWSLNKHSPKGDLCTKSSLAVVMKLLACRKGYYCTFSDHALLLICDRWFVVGRWKGHLFGLGSK